MTKEINGSQVLFLINNSPLTKYHLLIVNEVKANHPQVMTLPCLVLALNVMMSTNDKAIRLGYNSPGALASVNHLHLHMIHIEQELYVERLVSWIETDLIIKNLRNHFLETGEYCKKSLQDSRSRLSCKRILSDCSRYKDRCPQAYEAHRLLLFTHDSPQPIPYKISSLGRHSSVLFPTIINKFWCW